MSRPAAARPPDALERLSHECPELCPWLGLLRLARLESTDPVWETALPAAPLARDGAPLLDEAVVTVSGRAVDRWIRTLLGAAAANGGPAGSLAAVARSSGRASLDFLEAALSGDAERLGSIARANDAEGEALAAVAPLAAMPLLQACGRRWRARAAPDWDRGYCPICAAWPVLAEARGLEGERRLRCARCGGDWRIDWLRCPYCGTRDHLRLGALVPEGAGQTRKVDTCSVCRRYVKTITVLQPTPPADVGVLDVATVDLDLGALASGHVGPRGLGRAIAVRVTPRPRRLAWPR